MTHLGSLDEFLATHHPQAHEDGHWGPVSFHLASYLCAKLPPLALITSARAVLRRPGQIMVVRDPGSMHVLPGGRRRVGESLEHTLRRELLEETGWTANQLHLLGVRHFHQHGLKLSAQPWPDFFQTVSVADAAAFRPEAREVGGYELESGFRSLGQVRRLRLTPGERLFLRAALQWSAADQFGG